MGWNQGYTIFEATVVGAYDLGRLDKKLLKVLMEPYRGTDIDSGGSRGLKSKDGKCVQQIVIETFGGKMPKEPPKDAPDEKWEEYHDAAWGKFFKITDRFGWG